MKAVSGQMQISIYCIWAILLMGGCGSSSTVTRIGDTKYPGTSEASPLPIFWPSNAGQQPENLLSATIPARIINPTTLEALYDSKTEKAVPFEKTSTYFPIGLIKLDKNGDRMSRGHVLDLKRRARRTGAHAIIIRRYDASDGFVFIEALFIRWKEKVSIR